MQLLTVEQVAERLVITKRSVEELLRRGIIPWVNVSLSFTSEKPRKRIKESDLIAFIEARRQQSTKRATSVSRRLTNLKALQQWKEKSI